MIITTSYEPDLLTHKRALNLSKTLEVQLVKREKKSLQKLFNLDNEIIIVEKEIAKYYSIHEKNPFFFHPSMAVLRINRLKKGDNDILVSLSDLRKGDTFLDCTLGLGTDSIVASYIVGEKGQVVGIESQKIIGTLVEDGFKLGWPKDIDIDQAMKRIKVRSTHHLDYLKSLPDKSFDIVYFDPMFRTGVKKSSSINPLRQLANDESLTLESVNQAKRVAKRMVILKENTLSDEFSRLGFTKHERSSSTTYGYIKLNRGDEE